MKLAGEQIGRDERAQEIRLGAVVVALQVEAAQIERAGHLAFVGRRVEGEAREPIGLERPRVRPVGVSV